MILELKYKSTEIAVGSATKELGTMTLGKGDASGNNEISVYAAGLAGREV